MELGFFYFLITLLIAGIFSGFFAGLLGVGGGLIIIPVIYYILNFYNYSFEISMHVAIASSLGVICINSLSSFYTHYNLKNIDLLVIKKWSIGVISGSYVGAIFASSISGETLIIIFVFIASILSINMFLNLNIILSKELPKYFMVNNFISFFVGFFSVIIGIGGGSFTVPILTAFSKPIHKAIGSSALIGFFIALPGLLTYSFTGKNVIGLPPFSFGYPNLLIILLIAFTSVFTANIGAKLSSKIKTSILKKIFAVFLFSTCISLIVEHYIF